MCSNDLSPSASLEERVTHFRSDPEKLRSVTEFVDELLLRAKMEAEEKKRAKERTKFEIFNEEAVNLKRRIGTRARGFIVRMFEALCNCTNTGPAAAARAARRPAPQPAAPASAPADAKQ